MNNITNYEFWKPSIILFASLQANLLYAQTKPNIVVILTDDQGYADFSHNPYHADYVHTPNMDALANEGIFFSQAYTSGNTCSPTRAGIMTGRYQHRTGIYDSGEGGSGMPLTETLFPKFLKPLGYVCGAFGKWHLGLTPEYNPISRGFDEFYGFMGRGAHDYYDLSNESEPLFRGLTPITDEGYLTNLLTAEAIDFIKRHKEDPFFCYLAYNAVHAPAEAPPKDIAAFNTGDPTRDILMAMLMHLDNGIGDVVRTLKEEGLYNNTLLIFLTDNGGPTEMHADNTPLRDFKQTNWEGGIRTPFVLSWPDKYAGGRVIETPIISLDILPTVLDAVGIDGPVEKPFDGKSILPLLTDESKPLHEMLFWTEGGVEGQWAVRYKDWKLVVVMDQFELFDLGNDPSETNNLASIFPDTLNLMAIAFDKWLDEMPDPMQLPSKRWTPAIKPGQIAALYDEVYYRGKSQSLNQPGIFTSDILTVIGADQTSSLLLANDYDALAFSENNLEGEKLLITSGRSSLGSFDEKLSSMVLYPEGNQDMRSLDITASLSEETAQLVMDKDLSTYWDIANKGAWIKFSLCREVNLKGVKIAFKRGNLRVAYLNVDVSLDGTNWTPVISGGESSGSQTTLELFSFPEVKARYIRIIGNGNSDNLQNHYTEVEFVYGEENTEGIRIEAEDYNRATRVTKFIVDDCQSILAIDAKEDGSTVDYDLSLAIKGQYKMDIRIKAFEQGTLEIKNNNITIASIVIDQAIVEKGWTTLSELLTLPKGDITLTLKCNASGQGSLFQINWFDLLAITLVEQVTKYNASSSVLLYPNPCSQELHISSVMPMETIRIMDGGGRIVLEYTELGESAIINTGMLANGMYFVQIISQKGVEYLKFIRL
ncbi:MAG: sulfatase-like hydrolase/transferase [Bacteroidia bacterium]|nr:sulfatase-like hydrolase/transferase [Bacteroidia bacterium]